jgi:hypothetical protein
MGVADTGAIVTSRLTKAPLPEMIERLGQSVAQAQAALDENAIHTAVEMAQAQISIGGKSFNLLSLGFAPSFYAFTEATVEARLSFSMEQEQSFSIGVSIGGGKPVDSQPAGTQHGSAEGSKGSKFSISAVNIDANYSQRFNMEASGSSSIGARLVSVPPPAIFQRVLEDAYLKDAIASTPTKSEA